MPLTDIKIRNAKQRDRDYKLYDGSGLYVLVHKNGSHYWRLKYKYADKEKILALGVYPDIRLNEARERAQDARELVKQGIDPTTHRRETKARNIALSLETFQVVRRMVIKECHEMVSFLFGKGVSKPRSEFIATNRKDTANMNLGSWKDD